MHADLTYSAPGAEEVLALNFYHTEEERQDEKSKQIFSALARRNIVAAIASLPTEIRDLNRSIATVLHLLFLFCRWKEEFLVTPLPKPREQTGKNGMRVLQFEYRFAVR